MAKILPGWDSIDAVGKWLRGFEIAGFIALGLLLLFEVLSYIYGNRKDVLSAQQQVAAIAKETAKQEQARRDEARFLQEKIDAANYAAQQAQANQIEARHKLEKLQKAAEPRRLSEQQEQEFSAFLDKAPRGNLTINASTNADDARGFADQIASLLTRKGWNITVNNSMFVKFKPGGPDLSGLWMTVKSPSPTAAPQRAGALQQAFKHIGITVRGEWDDSIQDPDQVFLCIGGKEFSN